MEKTQESPSTKDAALQALGVVSKKDRKALSSQVEFVRVGEARHLLARGAFTPTVLVGVAGSVMVSTEDGRFAQVQAPFVIDFWAADARRIAQVTVVTESPTALVLVDWRHRDAVFSAVSSLETVAKHTVEFIADATQEVVDLTEAIETPESVLH